MVSPLPTLPRSSHLPIHPPNLTSFLFLENKQVLMFKRPQSVLLTLTVRASKGSFLSLRMKEIFIPNALPQVPKLFHSGGAIIVSLLNGDRKLGIFKK